MICYCVFTQRPDDGHAAQFVSLEDESGRNLEAERGVEWTPHPVERGHWRLGPFYVADRTLSEVPRPDLL